MQTNDLIFYQIYPKSFCDSNGDGIGDIRGIISKIEYLQNLGVNAVWLSPCFKSPFVDNGYDISDYRDIDASVGTLADLEEMIDGFHKAGIKIILDLVANHTSTAHPWFLHSRASKDDPYREYYIWRKTPPNDWQSLFGGSAWEYDERTGEYYLHSFAKEQADLNWDNPKVRREMQDIVRFWVEKGVDGFRCDVLDMISKDLISQYNGSGPRLHEYIRELFAPFYGKIFTVGECWSSDKQNAALFCGRERRELTTVFSFHHLCIDADKFAQKKPPLQEVCRRIADWQCVMQELDAPAAVFLGNHDQPRAVSRFGDDTNYRYESATMLGGLTLLHRGIPFLFQGEEWGVANSTHTSILQFEDVESRNYYEENRTKLSETELLKRLNANARDQARRMLPWTEQLNKSWCSPYTRQNEINFAKESRAKKSVYAFYRDLIALRKAEPCLTKGTYRLKELTNGYYAFERSYQGERILVACCFEKSVNAPKTDGFKPILSNYEKIGKKLYPYQLIVYRKT